MFQQMNLAYRVIKPETVEQRKPGEAASDYVVRNAKEKAEWVFEKCRTTGEENVVVVAADTVVALDEDVLEKPRDPDHAREMLQSMSARWHTVFSGVCIQHSAKQVTLCAATKVLFAQLSEQDIEFYLSTGEPFDKAGAYGLQGAGRFLVKRLEGSYSNVIGLPLHETLHALAQSPFSIHLTRIPFKLKP